MKKQNQMFFCIMVLNETTSIFSASQTTHSFPISFCFWTTSQKEQHNLGRTRGREDRWLAAECAWSWEKSVEEVKQTGFNVLPGAVLFFNV